MFFIQLLLGNVAGQLPKANYIATGGSVICLDKICNTTVDGDIDLSVNMTAPQVHTGNILATVFVFLVSSNDQLTF